MSVIYVKHDYRITGNDYIETDGGEAPAGGIDYSEDEHETGINWIDGKPIYEKTINCGAGPNNTTKQVAHGISDIDNIIRIKGAGFGTGGDFKPMPFVQAGGGGLAYQIQIDADKTNINIKAAYNAVNTNVYITLQYTKTE